MQILTFLTFFSSQISSNSLERMKPELNHRICQSHILASNYFLQTWEHSVPLILHVNGIFSQKEHCTEGLIKPYTDKEDLLISGTNKEDLRIPGTDKEELRIPRKDKEGLPGMDKEDLRIPRTDKEGLPGMDKDVPYLVKSYEEVPPFFGSCRYLFYQCQCMTFSLL